MTTDGASSVHELERHIESAEEAYEFLISFAGKGIDHEQPAGMSDEVREYLEQFGEALTGGYDAASAVPEEYSIDGEQHYERALDTLADEIDEARTIIDLLAAQEPITSAQVDNMNGMAVFQSVMMKFFFLDELTAGLRREPPE